MNNRDSINDLVIHHDKILHGLLNQLQVPAPRIHDAILYSLFPGGKRLRPILVYLCGNLIDIKQTNLDYIAASIELTHCYSLVHDDLPAMDNDDMRRGRPSCHRAFDEATAILVGDALQSLAIEILLSHLPNTLTPQQVIDVSLELVRASGPHGMVSGQSLDLTELTNPALTESKLCEIHRLKTGKLISACINMVIAAGKPPIAIAEALRQFADHLGLAFQMQDDYLDEHDNGKFLGKGRSSDAANQKITFAKLYERSELANLIADHFQKAEDNLAIFDHRADVLREFVRSLHRRSL